MDLWNKKKLEPPPVNSCKTTTKDIDIRLLNITLKAGIVFFENHQHLSTEAALLSRTVYRLKMKFRSSKDFKAVEKLSRVLRIYLQMQISKSLRSLMDSIPENYKANRAYTLSKNMLDYVLVQMQSLGKILCRILETCKVISNFTQQRVILGHFWKVAAVIYAITARIFTIAKRIFKYTCEMYCSLLPFSKTLSNSKVQWLPEDYGFPSRLDVWLHVECLNLKHSVIEIPDEESDLSFFKLIEDSDDDVEFCDEYVIVNDDLLVFSKTELSNRSHLKLPERSNQVVIDIGEVVNLSNNESREHSNSKQKRLEDCNTSEQINQTLIASSNDSVGELVSIEPHSVVGRIAKKRKNMYRTTKKLKKK